MKTPKRICAACADRARAHRAAGVVPQGVRQYHWDHRVLHRHRTTLCGMFIFPETERYDWDSRDRNKKASKSEGAVERDDLMERTRAAVCISKSRPFDEDLKLAGFMALFHPNYKGPRLKAGE